MRKVTINLYEEDYERCHIIFASVGASVGIRELLHQYITQLDTLRARSDEPLLRELEVELNDQQ